ncbi:MAG TPA: MFS transporter [Paracoccaceae bacterium]|nr:MFS transporter [Paracoccaceae bacterium]
MVDVPLSAPAPAHDDRRAKRNVVVLVLAQAILGAQMPVNFVLGGLAGQTLSPEPCLATLPISLIVLGSMLAAPNVSAFMGRYGRRAGFLLGAFGGMTGATLCAAALFLGSFPLFLVGTFCTGLYMSAHGFYRFAAADGASDTFRPKAISWVMAGGLASAVIGPQMVKLTSDALAPVPFAGAYVSLIALNLVGSLLFLFLDSPRPPRPEAGAPRGRTLGRLLRTPRIAVAMICGMVSYALMNLSMTSTPLAVVGCGYAEGDAADVVMVHVLAMFLPSFFTGHVINRVGVERVIAAGLLILAASGLIALSGVRLEQFYGALFLLGIGWNFGYIGATSMLAGAHSPEERSRVQGMNDFAVFGLVTVASVASGGLMNCAGTDPEAGWALVNLAMIPFLALAGGALLWFVIRRPEAA